MLVETVRGAASFERETFESVTRARSEVAGIKVTPELLNDPAAFQQFEQAQGRLSGALSRLLVVVERYPDLKATQAFRDLQAQLEGTENRIAVARMRYVEAVEEYNKLVRFFPSNLTARFILRVDVRPTFEARAGAELPPEIQF
jgi:LemA protein